MAEGERVMNAASIEDNLIVDLAGGRSVSVPLACYPVFSMHHKMIEIHGGLELVLGFTDQ